MVGLPVPWWCKEFCESKQDCCPMSAEEKIRWRLQVRDEEKRLVIQAALVGVQ